MKKWDMEWNVHLLQKNSDVDENYKSENFLFVPTVNDFSLWSGNRGLFKALKEIERILS